MCRAACFTYVFIVLFCICKFFSYKDCRLEWPNRRSDGVLSSQKHVETDKILFARIEECLREQGSRNRKRTIPRKTSSVKGKKKRKIDKNVRKPTKTIKAKKKHTKVKIEYAVSDENTCTSNDEFGDTGDCINRKDTVLTEKTNDDSRMITDKIDDVTENASNSDKTIELQLTKTKSRKRRQSKSIFQCSECDKSFSRLYALNNHVDALHGIKRSHCVVCGLMFSRNEHVARHMKTRHQNVTEFACDECPESFTTIKDVVAHGLFHRKMKEKQDPLQNLTKEEKQVVFVKCQEPGKREYGCFRCTKSFGRLYMAREHANVHLNLTPFKCDHCQHAFHSQGSLSKHLHSAHEESITFKCPKCKRNYSDSDIFQTHVEQCERQHVCDSCDSAFYRHDHLKRHKETVHEKAVYHCHLCTKIFTSKFRLNYHISYTHEGKKKPKKEIICDICGLSFEGTFKLNRHMSVHTGNKAFKCSDCDKQYLDSNSLKNHVLTVHLQVKPYVCEICAMEFTVKSNMLRHLRRHRGEFRFFCEDCGKGFIANCDLTRHKLTHNPSKGTKQ